jgi:hypothetical protein
MLQLFVKGLGFVSTKESTYVKDLLYELGADSMYYGGRLLDPSRTINSFGLQNNATLEVSKRLLGGMNPFKVLGELFKLILGLIKIVIKIVTLVTKPAQCIMLIIAFIVVSFLFVFYFLWTLPPFIWLLAAVWYFAAYVVPMIIYCMIFIGLLIAVFVICVILTALNTVTGGALRSIVLCDSLPSAWHSIPNFHLTNKWERGMMCTRPCPPRYMPNPSGSMCVKKPAGYPAYCPQAEAMRIFSRKKADMGYMYKKFDDSINVKYMLKTPAEREEILKNYYIKRKNFSDTCSASMSEYDNISLNICAAADSLKGVLDDNQIARLKQVCAQAYCTPERNYPFCSKTSDLNDNDANAVIRKVVKIVMIIITIMLTILLALTFMYNDVNA